MFLRAIASLLERLAALSFRRRRATWEERCVRHIQERLAATR